MYGSIVEALKIALSRSGKLKVCEVQMGCECRYLLDRIFATLCYGLWVGAGHGSGAVITFGSIFTIDFCSNENGIILLAIAGC